VGRQEGQSLNREFRGKDYPTNVLTFPYCGLPAISADLVLCEPVIAAEARRDQKPLDHHLAHLVVHGVLHAAGFDHEKHEDALQMEALEAAILKRFRIPDPYQKGL
jgi:probable rRNA maturation factor